MIPEHCQELSQPGTRHVLEALSCPVVWNRLDQLYALSSIDGVAHARSTIQSRVLFPHACVASPPARSLHRQGNARAAPPSQATPNPAAKKLPEYGRVGCLSPVGESPQCPPDSVLESRNDAQCAQGFPTFLRISEPTGCGWQCQGAGSGLRNLDE